MTFLQAKARGAAPSPEDFITGAARLSEDQVKEHVQALIAAGVDPAKVEAAIRADGYAVPVLKPKPLGVGDLAKLLAKAAAALRR